MSYMTEAKSHTAHHSLYTIIRLVDNLDIRLFSKRNLLILFLLDPLQWAGSIFEGQRGIKIIPLSLQF